jgi:hypothetical protein
MTWKQTRLLMALVLDLGSIAQAGTAWYVDGVNGNDNDNCNGPQTACKTIGHAISLASSGDTIKVAAATYVESLTIGLNLKVIGSGAKTTIIDGSGIATVVNISSTSASVVLSRLTIRNGFANSSGAGILNRGILTINACTISNNKARGEPYGGFGAGVTNAGTLTVNNSTFSDNSIGGAFGAGFGAGLFNYSTATINNSTFSGNRASGWGGGIGNEGVLTVNNSTISSNTERYGGVGNYTGTVILQNSIVANNSGGNCYARAPVASNGYNLSSDKTCNFTNTGDVNNTDPKLGGLQYNSGPTQTMALPPGSPAIDAGNPNGCTDSKGHLLKTDQRGMPRPDKEDTGGCDMGAYESQSD